jgi:DNA-binding LacI/PurR family transcriptional regulator
MGVGEVIHQEDRDIKVVSFDDFPSSELFGIKSLNHDPRQLGLMAAEVLLGRIQNPTGAKFKTHVMKLQLGSKKNHQQKAVANG